MKYQNIELHNVWDTYDAEDAFGISRLPLGIVDDINKNARNMSKLASACEIRGVLKEGGEAKIVLKVLDDNVVPPVVLVYRGDFCEQTIYLQQENTEIIIKDIPKQKTMEDIANKEGFAFHPKLVRVRLPHIHNVHIVSIEGDLSYPDKELLPKKTLLSYGSSITHGASSISADGTYASQCARKLGYDLINLGVGGAAQMDMPIADHIATRDDWDIATLEMGINVRNWEPKKFREAVDLFVTKIVETCPDKYIFCIDLFTNDADFEKREDIAIGFREIVREIANKFNSSKVMHIDGREILKDPYGLRTDLVHPNCHGMQEMGFNLADKIFNHLKSTST
jgi:hypothetical protein